MDKPGPGAPGASSERVSARVGSATKPPRVEQVLTPAELEREVLYAGFTTADT